MRSLYYTILFIFPFKSCCIFFNAFSLTSPAVSCPQLLEEVGLNACNWLRLGKLPVNKHVQVEVWA